MSIPLDPALAAQTGVPAKMIAAIGKVESNGNPSAVRFEPHIFWRIVLGLPSSTTGAQITAQLTPAQQAQVPYTPGPTGAASHVASETNASAVARAVRVNAAAAVNATSWGMYQNLGSSLIAIAGPDPAAAVAAFTADPAGMSRRLFAKWVSDALRAPATGSQAQINRHNFVRNANALDFDKVASAYNGCDDCTLYAGRLRTAYASPTAEAAGGGLLLAAATGLGLWLWSRRRR